MKVFHRGVEFGYRRLLRCVIRTAVSCDRTSYSDALSCIARGRHHVLEFCCTIFLGVKLPLSAFTPEAALLFDF